MNLITIDPSINNTAIIVNGKIFCFTNKELMFSKTGKLTKWFELANPFVEYFPITYTKADDYSTNEILKLDTYHQIANTIVDVILMHCNSAEPFKVCIEGYSYNSAAGPIIDLVTFSTLLRYKLYEHTEDITVISPTSLKHEAAKLTYPAIRKGKKVIKYEYRNHQGIAGGSFTKTDIFYALIENNNLQGEWVNFLRAYKKEITNNKVIAKPLEDINDAELMYRIYENR